MEEAPQEEVMGVSKGKRTKRVRPQSLITFMAINAHSSSGDANVDGTVHEEVSIIDNNNNNNSSSPLVVTSDENFPDEDVPTEEEEEMAKCLILLSQGGHPPLPHHHHHHPRQTPPNKFFDLFNNDMGFYQTKFNSKRYVETTDLGNGAKAGTYVYECKTCNRTFPSFQALGGHRASHRKPKPLTIEPKKQPFFYFSNHDDPSPPPPSATTTATTNYKYNNKLSPMLSPLSAQFNNINMLSPRIHTCSYCGAEFTSGQALGGHMRRHRGGANNNNNNNTILCLSPFTIDQESTNYNNLKKPRNGLSLDLNLPAPTEYHQNQSRNLLQHPPKHPQEQPQKQQQEQQEQDEQQQTALVLSTTPQLIGCHY